MFTYASFSDSRPQPVHVICIQHTRLDPGQDTAIIWLKEAQQWGLNHGQIRTHLIMKMRTLFPNSGDKQ